MSAQDLRVPGLQDDGAIATPDGSGAKPVIVWCLVADFGAQKLFYSPLHRLESATAGQIDRLSARFVRSVNAQHRADLGDGRHACAGSASTLAAATALNRTMQSLLSQGFVAVPIGVY